MNQFVNVIEVLPKYWEMFLLTMLLPTASVLALILRKDLLKGKIKYCLLILGLGLLSYTIYEDIKHHADEIGLFEILFASVAALVTFIILSFAHKHTDNENDVRGIAIAEFFHSCLDGAIIGMAYFVNPLLGYGTFLAIVTHEAPKILGTVILIRALTKSNWEAVKYSALCQAGVPLVATFIYVFGKNISGEWTHAVEFAAMATIAVILVRIAWHTYSHSGHAHE
jgi:zinc transporter ZupT